MPDGGVGGVSGTSVPDVHVHVSCQIALSIRSFILETPLSKSLPRERPSIAAISAAVKVGTAGGSVAQNVDNVSGANPTSGIIGISHVKSYAAKIAANSPLV